MSETPAPALKEWFNEARYRQIARDVAAIHRGFDTRRFLALTLPDLAPLALLARLRRATEALRATLPDDYATALDVLRELAPSFDHNFVSLVLPDFVGLYGLDDFDRSLDALKFFTTFGSSEFAIREFLRRDLPRTLRTMERWSRDDNEHVRRLASEGSRPRLPWSFKLTALIADPSPVAPILENLRADPSLYVRKSVANHLNDITKDHPAWVLDRLATWDLGHPHTAWIAKRALRTLIKMGDRRALGVIGAGERARIQLDAFSVSPRRLQLGETLTFACTITSTARRAQKLVIDYAIHYVKQSGTASAKVFKWKETTLAPGASLTLVKRQRIQDFTTRKHHAGKHAAELMVNGERIAEGAFNLVLAKPSA
ncbi:MAG: DNA alkylation repair protein [Chthoniobacteraceae bacterium]